MNTTTQSSLHPRATCALRITALVMVAVFSLMILLYGDRLEELTTLGYIGAFVAMLVGNATLILPAPGLMVVFAVGSTLNPVLAGVCGSAGGTLGELTGYLTGYSGVGVLQDSAISRRIHRWMGRSGMLTIFILSIIPNPFFDMAGIIAGAGRMPLPRFLGVTFCGKTIQAVLVAFAGALSLHWIETWL